MVCQCIGCAGRSAWLDENRQKFQAWLENREHQEQKEFDNLSALDATLSPLLSVKEKVKEKMKEFSA